MNITVSSLRTRSTGIQETALVFGLGAVLLLVCTRVLIPYLSEVTGMEPIAAWFLVGGFGTFAPLVVLGIVLLRRERRSGAAPLFSRLRVRPLSRGDWAWAAGAIFLIVILGFSLQIAMRVLTGRSDLNPDFMTLDPVSPGRYWILIAWFPFWIVNILGEEFLWRGVILPRQELVFGRHAWLVNGFGWLVFHAAFGVHLLVLLVPIIFVLPYVVQRRRSTSIGAVIHAAVNGPAFIAVAFGVV